MGLAPDQGHPDVGDRVADDHPRAIWVRMPFSTEAMY